MLELFARGVRDHQQREQSDSSAAEQRIPDCGGDAVCVVVGGKPVHAAPPIRPIIANLVGASGIEVRQSGSAHVLTRST